MADEIEIGESRTVKATKNMYQPNSHKSKKPAGAEPVEREAVEAVVTSGSAKQRKKGLGKRIAETFTGDDAKSVASYVLFDVILPAAKAMISDAASQGVERLLFGDVRGRARPGRSEGPRGGYNAYNRVYSTSPTRGPEPTAPRQLSSRARATHDFDDIVVSNRGEAEMVIDRLDDRIQKYGSATVNDLYGFVDITGSFTDDKWGWYGLEGASVSRVRDGFLLNLPPTEVIE